MVVVVEVSSVFFFFPLSYFNFFSGLDSHGVTHIVLKATPRQVSRRWIICVIV